MLPVSGAEQLNGSAPIDERPMISHSGAYSSLLRLSGNSSLGRNRFHRPCALAFFLSSSMTGTALHRLGSSESWRRYTSSAGKMCSSRNALMRWRSSAARALGGVSMVSSCGIGRGFSKERNLRRHALPRSIVRNSGVRLGGVDRDPRRTRSAPWIRFVVAVRLHLDRSTSTRTGAGAMRLHTGFTAMLLVFALVAACGRDAPAAPAGLERVQHIVVLFLENRSFDNLYGLFPGAEGLQNLDRIAPQVDDHGEPYKVLPRALDSRLRDAATKEGDPHPVDPRIPGNLPNRPFRLDPFVPLDAQSGDLVHRFRTEQRQINAGKMDRFIVEGDSGSLPLG